ncbi:MAG: hypothetical protein H8E20_07885 [Verrucomicrobia bacterium]|nr:hypothetical protein [Verrucomicrobiota bacterium]
MATAGSSWEVAVMRPGGDPLTNLAEALIEADIHDAGEDHIHSHVRASLARSGMGLVEAVKQGDLPENTNLLLVVDQFEEIFRFRRMSGLSEEEAGHFITLLLEASEQIDLPVYVVLTMRSDFLGDCAQFRGLAEAVNDGEYLIPRLNRNQRRQAIEGPVAVGQREITSRLVQRLLNDIGDDPDQLPILQHALMRTWDYWDESGADGPLDLDHYQATGGMDEALSRHADEVHAELADDGHRWIAEKLFKALTEKVDQNRGIRRPMQFRELCEIIEKEEPKIRAVVDAFRRQGRTFLMPSGEAEITPKTVIDISHESLMRAWRRLRDWVDDEAQSAKIYRRLADTSSLYQEGKAGYYRDPDLQIALSWREETKPNKTWADHYFAGFDEAMAFLDQSHDEAVREEREREEARQRELAQAQALAKAEQERAEAEQAKAEAMERLAITQKRRAILATVLSVVAITASIIAGFAWKQAKENEEKAILALVSGQELSQEDVDKALEIMQGQQGGLPQFAESMRQKSGGYARNGDFDSALVAINAANKTDPQHKYSKLYASRINLALGNFDQAKNWVYTFVKLEEESPHGNENFATMWWQLGASLIAKTGDVDAYSTYCQKMFDRFHEPKHDTTFERLAKGSIFLKIDAKQVELARNYAQQALGRTKEGTNYYNWFCFTMAIVEYRSGDMTTAEQWCDRSLSYTSATHPFLPGLNNALLSMIHFKTNRQAESEKTWQTAKDCLANLEGNENGLSDKFLLELLIKERESLAGN